MTKTDERLALIQRQRRFEWELAREAQVRAAGKFVSGKTHDLLNLVQIVQLASLELRRRCGDAGEELVVDLLKAADEATHELRALMAVARPDELVVPGDPVGAALTAALASVRAAGLPLEPQLAVRPEVTTRCTAAELEHLIYGLALDAAEPLNDAASPIELFVRVRAIDGAPWLEIVCSGRTALEGEHFDLRAVETIAVKNGGELTQSERRGGGTEVVVALPIVH